MQPVLLISDLHLHVSRPNITELFLKFLKEEVGKADALYILGDLFEFWIGDDDPRVDYIEVIAQLQLLSGSDTSVYFMPGNRDFLVGDSFSRQSGCTLLNDPTQITLFGKKVLLIHGDTLCTDDHDYQEFRLEVRSDEWRTRVLAMPVDERIEYFDSLREASQTSIQEKASDIMDVNQPAVETAMLNADTLTLIHGHTHRPAIHDFLLDGQPAKRYVLGDWYEQGSVLVCDKDGFRLETRLL